MTSDEETDQAPDQVVDVLVIGSGAAGLAAAVTAAFHGLDVLVVEKAPRMGGATAWSGGWMLVPGNPYALADDVTDGVEGAREYLRNRLGDNYNDAKIEAFLTAAGPMVAFFAGRTELDFVPGKWIADIHGATPGAGTGHRSVGPKPIAKDRLSPEVQQKLARQLYETSFLGMGIMAGPDLQNFLKAAQLKPAALWHASRRVAKHAVDLGLHREGRHLVNGLALIGRLLQSAHDLGVALETDCPATSLVTDHTGAVTGAVVAGATGSRYVRARKGVVLAAGGFPADLARRIAMFPRELGEDHHTLAPRQNTGDGLRLGESVGGRVDDSLASPVAWCPVSEIRYASTKKTRYFPHIMDRAKPGVIGVLADGSRFVNEANGYHDYVSAMIEATPEGGEVQSWLIADATYLRRYPLGMAKPFPVPTTPYLRNGYLKRGASLRELAQVCGIDPAGLEATVTRFNDGARQGIDPQFGRGETAFNRYGGDPEVTPNPSLAPIETPPFYAVRVLPGSFGTFAGLVTDPRARVVDAHDRPIAGLYAVGTDQASVFGGHYPSGGINIGPAMVFGYIAGRDLAGVTGWEVSVDAAAQALKLGQHI